MDFSKFLTSVSYIRGLIENFFNISYLTFNKAKSTENLQQILTLDHIYYWQSPKIKLTPPPLKRAHGICERPFTELPALNLKTLQWIQFNFNTVTSDLDYYGVIDIGRGYQRKHVKMYDTFNLFARKNIRYTDPPVLCR